MAAQGLGGTALLGTMTFGDTVDLAAARRILDAARDCEISSIDTANGYAGTAAESILGELLVGCRDAVRLATKAGIPHPDAMGASPLSAVAIDRCLTASLARLRTDHVDVFYLHQPDASTPLEETVAGIAEILRSGKARAWGVSNFASWQLYRLIELARDASIPPPIVAQQLYNVLARRVEDEFVAGSMAAQVSIVAYNPLCGGLLTGRHHREVVPDRGRFGDSTLAEMYRGRYWHRRMFDGVDQLSEVAAAAGLSLPEMAFRWVAYRPGVDGVLLGASRPEHVIDNARALTAGPLPDDVRLACDRVGDRLWGAMPKYNR